LPDLVQFLNAVRPDEKNGDCVTWAIRKLGNENYEPAISALVKLLEFRRPATEREKLGFYLRPQGIWEMYPSVGALPQIGKKALPAILGVISSDSTSATARENAVAVWMEIYRHSDQYPEGVGLLKQEEINAKDDATKQRLKWAVQRALTYCGPPQEKEGAACRQAASNAVP